MDGRATAYGPRAGGDAMEGGYASSVRGPDGFAEVRTLSDYLNGLSNYVTLAGNPSYYGQTYSIPSITFTLDGKSYTLNNVPAVVHDTGSAFKNAPEGRFDVPVARDISTQELNTQPFNGTLSFVPIDQPTFAALADRTLDTMDAASVEYAAAQAPALPQIRDDQTFNNYWGGPAFNPGAAAWNQPAAASFGGPVGPGDIATTADAIPGTPLSGMATLSSDLMHQSFDPASIAQPAYGSAAMPVDLASLPHAWGPKNTFGVDATANAQPVSGLVVHTFGAEKPGQAVSFDKSVSALNTYDPARGGAFGYTFAIDTDGTIVQTAPLDVRTNQVKPADAAQRYAGVAPDIQNANTYGIAYFNQTPNAPPTQAQLDAIGRLTSTLTSTFGINPANVYGHGELQGDRADTEGTAVAQAIRSGTLGQPSAVQTAGDLNPAAGADAFLGQQFDPYQSIQPAFQPPTPPNRTPQAWGGPDEFTRGTAFGALAQPPQTVAGGFGMDTLGGQPIGYGGLGAPLTAPPVSPTPPSGYAQPFAQPSFPHTPTPQPMGGIDEMQRGMGFGSLAVAMPSQPSVPGQLPGGITEAQRASALGGPPRYTEAPATIPLGLPTVNPNFASAPLDVQEHVAPTPPTGAGPQWSGADGTFDPTFNPGPMGYTQEPGGISEAQRAAALGGPPRYAEAPPAIPAGLPNVTGNVYAAPGVAEQVAPTPPTGAGPQWTGKDGSFDETLSPGQMAYGQTAPAPASILGGFGLDAFAGMPSGYGGLAPTQPAHPVTPTPATGYPAGSQPAYQSRGTTGAFGFGADVGQGAIAGAQSLVGGLANAGFGALAAPAQGEAALGRALNTPLDTSLTHGLTVTPADALTGTGWGAFAPQSTIDQATLGTLKAAAPTTASIMAGADALGTKLSDARTTAGYGALAAMPAVANVAQAAPGLLAGSIAPAQSTVNVAQTVSAPISQTPVVTQATPETVGAPAANTTYGETVAAAGASAPAEAPTSPFAGTPSPFGREAYSGPPTGQSGYTTGGGMDDYTPDASTPAPAMPAAPEVSAPPTAGPTPSAGAIPTAAAAKPNDAGLADNVAHQMAGMGAVAAASPVTSTPVTTTAQTAAPTRAATTTPSAPTAARGVSATTPTPAAAMTAPQAQTHNAGFGSLAAPTSAFPWATPAQQPSDAYSTATPFTPTGYGYAPEYAQIAATGGIWGGSSPGISSAFGGFAGFGSLAQAVGQALGTGSSYGGTSIGGSTGANAGQGAVY